MSTQLEKMLYEMILGTGIEKLFHEMNLISEVIDKVHFARFLGATGVMTELDDPYGDGDQHLLYGPDSKKLHIEWTVGSDYNPISNPSLSKWCKACFGGEIEIVQKLIDEAGNEDAKRNLLEKRESGLRFSGIFHVIAGSRYHGNPNHIRLAQMLINEGANYNAKDVAGYTPLHHCLTTIDSVLVPLHHYLTEVGNATSFEIAKLLIAAGANVNSTTRFGRTPLFEPIINCNYDAIKLLLENGCDPGIKDTYGMNCSGLAMRNPKMVRMLSKSYRRRALADREKITDVVKCEGCNGQGARFWCSGCYSVKYCSVACQKAHWKYHKTPCKENQKQNVVKVSPVYTFNGDGETDLANQITIRFWYNERTKKQYVKEVKPSVFKGKQKTMRLKVQISFDRFEDREALSIYNKERDYEMYIVPTDPGYQKVYDAVEKKGYGGKKVYFGATLLPNQDLNIHIGKPFPDTF